MSAHAPEPSLVGLDVIRHLPWRDLPMQGLLLLLPIDDPAQRTLDLLAREGKRRPQLPQIMEQIFLQQQSIRIQLGLQSLARVLQEGLLACMRQQDRLQLCQLLDTRLGIAPARSLLHG